MKPKILMFAFATSLLAAMATDAAISVNSAAYTYSQNFDTLASIGSTIGQVAWANDSTLPGWSLYRQPAPGTALTTYSVDPGTSTLSAFYSYGAGGSTERALGGLFGSGNYFGTPAPGNGAVAGWITVAFINNSGAALNGFNLTFDGEQWRNGGNASAQSMVLEYGFGSSFTSVGYWTAAGSSFNWSSPVTGTTAGAVNGNGVGKVAGVGGTANVTWNAGDTLWLRWVENNDSGNDHGMAIDNLVFTAVPEAASSGLIAATLLVGLALWKRRPTLAAAPREN